MAATTYDSTLTASTNRVAATKPWGAPAIVCLPDSETIDTTTLIATDFQRLFTVTNGALLKIMHLELEDPDTKSTEELDMDLILRDDDGDTILFNAGTAFQDAYDDWIELHDQRVNAEDSGLAYVGFYINTAAGTGVAAAGVKSTLFLG